jgi:CelD/BcsL family acetyltransferase involved in cellulose biosynthesis
MPPPPDLSIMTSMARSASTAATKDDQPLSVRVLHSFAEAESLRSAWNDLVLSSGADVYQTFDWCRLWWHYYGERRQLHLLLFFSGEELAGLVPAFIEILWLGPARLRVAKLVGADSTLHLCNLPVKPAVLSQAVARAIHHFLGTHRCDLLLLGPLSGPAAGLDILLATEPPIRKLVARAEILGGSCNTYFHLPGTFDEYLKAIGKQQRGNFNRSLTQFSKAHRAAFDAVSQTGQLGAEFECFRVLHNAQWRAEGKLGHFGDWPKGENFNRDLVTTLGAQGMVRFYRILADDQVISSQFCFVFGGVIYWRLPARVCGSEWDRLSFGRMGLIKMIEASMGEGQHVIEGGRGHYLYKLQLGGREWPLRTVQFVRRGSGVSTRLRCFRFLAALLDLAYYKIVFARIAPRLPVLQRPLWQVWIRSTW